ncbi:MAG: hypothetical protein EU547_01165 [Promethearchaeota archaeon]|nr:MAG: hypothetical protein EU547_01165 [Candidatus Lokiarchaeota archaeon]
MDTSNDKTYQSIIDSKHSILKQGFYKGSIISKMKKPLTKVILSDNINIAKNIAEIDGLMLDIKEGKFYLKHDIFSINIDEIDYSILVKPSIINQYLEGQFSNSFPSIKLSNTSCLYYRDPHPKIDYFGFFNGEILRYPTLLTSNGKNVIIGDRIVVDPNNNPTIYNAIISGRDKAKNLNLLYEVFLNIEKSNILYIFIIGSEDLKA